MNTLKTVIFNNLDEIVLIGGGDLLLYTAKLLNENNFNVRLLIAPRHAEELLPISNKVLSEELSLFSIKFKIISDINTLNYNELSNFNNKNTIAICFGPTWIFSEKTINAFSSGMFNINAIPIPHYHGGAHYTWQLLNNNFDGGCYFQQITTDIDKGDIFDGHRFIINKSAKNPIDYFLENHHQGIKFIEKLVKKIVLNRPFQPKPYQLSNDNRMYLPRLRTNKQGFINWQWNVDDIISFTQGFDDPYLGSATFILGQKVILKSVIKNTFTTPMHPFASGLVVHKSDIRIIIATPNGFIEPQQILDENNHCCKQKIKEGMRFHTPSTILDEAMVYQVEMNSDGFKD